MVSGTSSFWDESPENILAHAMRLYQNKELKMAETAFNRVIELDSTNEAAHVGLASIAASRSDHNGAYRLYKKAEEVVKSPNLRREVQMWLGVTSRRFGRLDESLKHLNEAVKVAPRQREGRYHTAATCLMMNKLDVAVEHMRHITTFNDADFQLLKTILAGIKEWNILAMALELCRASACSFSSSFTKAELLSWLARAQQNLGQTEESQRLLAEAVAESSDRQVQKYLTAFDEETRRNQVVLRRTDAVDKELDLLAKVLAGSAPNLVQYVKRALERCEWDVADGSPELLSAVRDHPGAVLPFTCITMPHLSASECLEVARAYTQRQKTDEEKVEELPPPPAFSPCDRAELAGDDRMLVVGVFSADFRPHPMAPILNTFFARAQDAKLEVIFFHKYAAPNYLAKIQDFVTKFVDVSFMKPGDIASTAREHNVQVWLETTGYTGSRLNCRHLFHRPAPVVVSWAGFPGSMGASEYVHYIVADEYSIPPHAADGYDEKPLRIPGSWLIADPTTYTVNDHTTEERMSLRADLLNVTDASTVVYAYLGRLWKVSRDDMDRWCRIARQVPNSVFWMFVMNTGVDPAKLAAENVRKHWEGRCGLDGRRLVFSQPFQLGEHLKAWMAADVALGTAHYNSGATALDALFSGVPLVHIAGGTKIMQRAEGSLLRAAGGLDELIAQSPFEYVQIATRLGRNESFRAHVSGRIDRIKNEPELSQLDPDKNVLALGRGMREAYRRYCDGEDPAEIPLMEEVARVASRVTGVANFTSPHTEPIIEQIIVSSPVIIGLAGFLCGLLLGWLGSRAYGGKMPKEGAKESVVARKKGKAKRT